MGIMSIIKSAIAPKRKINQYKKFLASDMPDKILSKISGHNMSMNIYKITAIYKPTNRSRTVQIYGVSEADAISHLHSDYLLPPKKIYVSEYDAPSREQVSYMHELGISIPSKCCKEDASALISMRLDEFKNSPAVPVTLKQFANYMRISYSLYLNEPHLVNYLYNSLAAPEEKIALMVASLYRKKNRKWNFSQWDKWVDFGRKAYKEKSFHNSLMRNNDGWGPFYGFEEEYNPPSEKTIVYQTIDNCLKFL